MMKCPKCGELLEAKFDLSHCEEGDIVAVEMGCNNEHLYFCQVTINDLKEA